MSQFCYLARSAAGTDAALPSGWNFGWQYPDDARSTGYPTTPVVGGQIPGLPFPPNWPQAAPANTLVINVVPTTIAVGTHAAVIEAYITINGSQTAASVLANHLIMVTALESGASRSLKKSTGSAYVTALYYKVTNYAGNKWGFTDTITFDPSSFSIGDIWDVDSKIVTIVAAPEDDDTFTVIS